MRSSSALKFAQLPHSLSHIPAILGFIRLFPLGPAALAGVDTALEEPCVFNRYLSIIVYPS